MLANLRSLLLHLSYISQYFIIVQLLICCYEVHTQSVSEGSLLSESGRTDFDEFVDSLKSTQALNLSDLITPASHNNNPSDQKYESHGEESKVEQTDGSFTPATKYRTDVMSDGNTAVSYASSDVSFHLKTTTTAETLGSTNGSVTILETTPKIFNQPDPSPTTTTTTTTTKTAPTTTTEPTTTTTTTEPTIITEPSPTTTFREPTVAGVTEIYSGTVTVSRESGPDHTLTNNHVSEEVMYHSTVAANTQPRDDQPYSKVSKETGLDTTEHAVNEYVTERLNYAASSVTQDIVPDEILYGSKETTTVSSVTYTKTTRPDTNAGDLADEKTVGIKETFQVKSGAFDYYNRPTTGSTSQSNSIPVEYVKTTQTPGGVTKVTTSGEIYSSYVAVTNYADDVNSTLSRDERRMASMGLILSMAIVGGIVTGIVLTVSVHHIYSYCRNKELTSLCGRNNPYSPLP